MKVPESHPSDALGTVGASLPEGYRLQRILARGGQGTVALCERGGRPVVLRLFSSQAGEAREALAELRVLARVDHPQLARLVDHGLGRLPGHLFVARTWVEGRTLDEHLGRPGADTPEREREIARVFAAIADALEGLHKAGFVHADLKPANVIVRADGTPVLTDFGLSSAGGRARGEVAGSLSSLAPEQLSGGVLDARTDLFALGALLYDALAPRPRSLASFYARFPAEDFFRAAGAEANDLPQWARTLVGELVLRDPSQRPASAALVATRLRAHLGEARARAERERWRWSARRGREAWFDSVLDELVARRAGAAPLLRLSLPGDEDPEGLVEELRLAASLRGARVLAVHPAADLEASASTRDLDRWCESVLARGEGATLLAALPPEAPLARRGLEYLARTLLAADEEHSTRLVLIGAAPAGLASEARELAPPPPVGQVELRAALESELDPGSRSRLDELAGRLWSLTRAEPRAVQAWLDEGVRAGVLTRAESGWRIAGSLDALVPRAADGANWSADAQRVALVLDVSGGHASQADLVEWSGLEPARAAAALEELLAARAIVRLEPSGEAWALRVAPPAQSRPGERRALHARRAEELAARGAPEHVLALERVLAAPDAGRLQAFFEALAALRERGLPERALEACARARRGLERQGEAVAPALVAEEAQAWAALGELERARARLSQLPSPLCPADEAAVERARGTIDARSYEHARALEHFTRAAELDPAQAGEATLGRALVLFETRREEELDQLFAQPCADGAARPGARASYNLDMLRALSWIRRGEFDAAEELLERRRAGAHTAGDALAEAAAELNLGTLRRRQGRAEEAQRCFERAAERSESAGALAGVAQARALLGGTLREAGELARSQSLLESALVIRERLGDEGGAQLVRGMLGLLLADRGHVLSASEVLARSAAMLESSGRRSDAQLLRARLDEQRARLCAPPSRSGPPAAGELAAGPEPDARVLLAQARAEAYRERRGSALALATRALEQAERLQQAGTREEARQLLALLRLDAPLADPDERTLLELLARDSCSAAELRRLRSAAESLERNGRDDRAARAWLGLAARESALEDSRAALQRAERLLERCTAGLEAEQSARFERTLLGRIDPWPLDIQRARSRAVDEELDMDMLKILEINHRLVRQEELAGLLGAIVESALSVTGGERGFLVLAEKGEIRLDTALDSRRGEIDEPEVEFSRSIVRRALAEKKPLRLSNAADDPDLGAAPSVTALELRSILCVPFVIEDELSGAIYVDHRVRAGAFAERAERLLSLLADQAALAIRQVRRMERIRELNRALNQEVVRKESDLRTARAVLRDAQLALPPSGLVGSSPAMRRVHQLLERAAPARLPVLLVGESGTGKELAARALHALSPRRERAFVSENCAAFPASLIEAELFGAKRGAFTGAEEDRSGLVERADGGTLFLDEIGELPLELQAKLLRVLETGELRRLGDSKVRHADFRLVAATNRDLEAEVRDGRFRADLYYRLDGLRIDLPPLRARVEDIPELVDHFLRLEAVRSSRTRTIAPAVMAALCRRAWPGNVRELANEVARLCVLSEGDLVDPALVRDPGATRGGATELSALGTLAELERQAIERTVAACGGDKTKAAELLGISRAKVYQRWKEWYGSAGD